MVWNYAGAIRRDFPGFHSHLILLTGNTDKAQVIEGLAAGADDYLTKPFHSGELVARVEVGRRIVELHREVRAKNRLLEEMALTDPLTGLLNRRAVDAWASCQLSAAAWHDFSFWVVMTDLDFFKKVNDTYGHDAGDTVLKTFADILKTNTRQSVICARLGGEEFLLMMTHVDKEGIKTAVERIRKQFENKGITFEDKTINATASFGIAGFRGSKPPDWNTLVSRADMALYTAKHKGRNRVEFEQDPRPTGTHRKSNSCRGAWKTGKPRINILARHGQGGRKKTKLVQARHRTAGGSRIKSVAPLLA